jgi:dipeptide/tripeptide permease
MEEGLALTDHERKINEKVERELAAGGDGLLFPKACWYIIPNELGERFAFYGMKPLFTKYLASFYGTKIVDTTTYTSLFTGLTYSLPLLGAAISDSYLGKFWTIINLSTVYALGVTLFAVFSVPGAVVPLVPLEVAAGANATNAVLLGPFQNNQVMPIWTFLLPAVLMAIGSGGIKPCVSAHGGDQYLPNQKQGLDFFFSIFYVAINIGALVSNFTTPFIRKDMVCFGASCYFAAFAICAGVFYLAMFIFAIGYRTYRIVAPKGVFLPWISLKICAYSFYRYLGASSEERRRHKGAVLNFANEKYDPEIVQETRLLGRVFAACLPIIFFWSIYDQSQNVKKSNLGMGVSIQYDA